MDSLSSTRRCNRRRPSRERPRRLAKTSRALLVEMPHHLRRCHIGGHQIKPTATHEPKKCRDERSVLKPTSTQGHVCRPAILWDDLVSIVRQEMMKVEKNHLPTKKNLDHNFSTTSSITSSSSMSSSILYPSVTAQPPVGQEPLSGGSFVSSPPRVKRVPFPFDATDVISRSRDPIPDVSSRLLAPLSPPPLARKSFSFNADSTHSKKSTIEVESCTHTDCDDDDTLSLEYSTDDDSDIERAIYSSSAIPDTVATAMQHVVERDFKCSICLDGVDGSNVATISGCGHAFCFQCIDRWAAMKNECPICKERFHFW